MYVSVGRFFSPAINPQKNHVFQSETKGKCKLMGEGVFRKVYSLYKTQTIKQLSDESIKLEYK